MACCSTLCKWKASDSMTSSPASIFEKSSTSFRIVSNASLEFLMMPA
jgi:hypothetical protein